MENKTNTNLNRNVLNTKLNGISQVLQFTILFHLRLCHKYMTKQKTE